MSQRFLSCVQSLTTVLILAAALLAGPLSMLPADDNVTVPAPVYVPAAEDSTEPELPYEIQRARQAVAVLENYYREYFWRVESWWASFWHAEPASQQFWNKQVQRCC